jgi:hypothetical protein
MSDALEMLRRFCAGADDDRENLRQPYSQGAHTYACNGHIAVRVQRIDGVPDSDKPNMAAVFDGPFAKATEFAPLPPLDNDSPYREVCKPCNGKGQVRPTKQCHVCNGTGECKCGECGHTHDCLRCRGRGEVNVGELRPCAECNGLGAFPAMFVQAVATIQYTEFYCLRKSNYEKIATLPNVTIGNPFGGHGCSSKLWSMPFRFEGGEGVVAFLKLYESDVRAPQNATSAQVAP